MKRILFILLATLFALSACGSDNQNADESNETVEENQGETQEDSTQEDSTQEDAEQNESDEEAPNDIYFEDGVAKIEDVMVEITETKVIPVGEEGNEHGDGPVFAIWYEATNFTDEDIDPTTAWIAIFEAVQDNDEDMVNELGVGSLPDEDHLDTQTNTIKKDGTVENSIAYELDDEETPVTLIATQGLVGDEIGREVYEIK